MNHFDDTKIFLLPIRSVKLLINQAMTSLGNSASLSGEFALPMLFKGIYCAISLFFSICHAWIKQIIHRHACFRSESMACASPIYSLYKEQGPEIVLANVKWNLFWKEDFRLSKTIYLLLPKNICNCLKIMAKVRFQKPNVGKLNKCESKTCILNRTSV